jgi:hypothetical protein
MTKHRVYRCARCNDSEQVLNRERVMSRDEAGPGYPSVFDPCDAPIHAKDSEPDNNGTEEREEVCQSH